MTTPRSARPPAGGSEGPSSRRLPLTQPARALTAVAGYLATVAVVVAVLSGLGSGPIVVLLSTGVALLLLVPLAVVLPVPRAETTQPDADLRPVLKRAERAAVAPPEAGASQPRAAGTAHPSGEQPAGSS